MKPQNKLPILLLLMAIVAAGCLLSRNQGNLPKVSLHEEQPVDAEPGDTLYDDDASCKIAFPKRALKPNLSKFRYAVKREGNDLVETVTQENGVRLVVTQGGCEDFVVIGFEFSAAANDFPKLPERQLVWVQDRLKEFNCVGNRCEMAEWGIALISKHLDKIKRAPSDIITKSSLRICHYDTVEGEPTKCVDSNGKLVNCENDYCSWETGGSTYFEVKSDVKGRVILKFVDARSA